MNNADLFYKNVKYLSKKQNKSIGAIERFIGVSQGYFSRMRSNQQKDVGAVKALKIAHILGVTLDDILTVDFEERNKEKDLEDEIKRLENELKNIRRRPNTCRQ